MFAQESPPDFDIPGRRESGERPERDSVAAPAFLTFDAPLCR